MHYNYVCVHVYVWELICPGTCVEDRGGGSLLESVPCGVSRTEPRSLGLMASSVTSAESSYRPLPCLFETGSTLKYPGCPGTGLLIEDDSELLILLSPPPDFWDYSYTGHT